MDIGYDNNSTNKLALNYPITKLKGGLLWEKV